MATQVHRAADALFPREGGHVRNVKFHRGWDRTATADQLAAELLSANEQIVNGTAVRVDDIDGDLTV